MIDTTALQPALAGALWWWAGNVFAPALALRQAGIYRPTSLGSPPPVVDIHAGRGPSLSLRFAEPVLLPAAPDKYELVEGFDECAAGYENVVRPFSDPICWDALEWLKPYVGPKARILDPSCGPGTMAIELARLFPEGEVVAADLSRGMVEAAHRQSRASRIANAAFFQADVGNPPEPFIGYFDAIFCCLSFHHYPDGLAAVRAFRNVLGPGGVACVADGGPAWFAALSRSLSVAADPGFIRHRTGEEFVELFTGAGFSSVFWVETLPGIGVTLARV